MALADLVSDSEDSSDVLDLMKKPKRRTEEEPSLPGSALSHRFRNPPEGLRDAQSPVISSSSKEKQVMVLVQGPSRPWEYQPCDPDDTVDVVLAEIDQPGGEVWYRIEYEDGRREDVSFADLIKLQNGRNALDFYNGADNTSATEMAESSLDPEPIIGKRTRTKTKQPCFVNSVTQIGSDEESGQQSIPKKKRRLQGQLTLNFPSFATREKDESDSEGSDASSKPATLSARQTRSNAKKFLIASDEPADSDDSDVIFHPRKASRGKRGRHHLDADNKTSPERVDPTRKSGRGRVIKSMKELDVDEELFAEETSVARASKAISIRETYQPVSEQSPFYLVHTDRCDVCDGPGQNSNKGPSPLVHCQGCSSSIHRLCLGYRGTREHLVTKIAHESFVMQCRRCVGMATKKDPLAPPLDTCQECKEPGVSCAAFSVKKTPKEEEKIRQDNGGDDPITEVPENLVNNAENVLFRCRGCQRAWHFSHLPPLKDNSQTPDDADQLRNLRTKEYSEWQCKECQQAPGKVQCLVAWRPANRETYINGQYFEDFRQDEREYLIKWAEKSYSKCTWMPGAWVWGVTFATMRKWFFDRAANYNPKWTAQEAIRDEYLRMEIILDVKYNGRVPSSLKSAKSRIADIEMVFVKFLGLGYDEAVWEQPPSKDSDLWVDFVAAYNEYLAGEYFKSESVTSMTKRITDFRALNFKDDVEQQINLSALIGGKLMPYQTEGMKWLLKKYHRKENAILGDEMGLGKTIQVIAFVTALVTDAPKCWPFLIVVPNSTCPNWRREFKKWAPDIRVVAFYGGKDARKLIYSHELFPGGVSDMRAHVVISSYEAPADDPFFKKIQWAGLVVDEGQRLKNDETRLYRALTDLRVPFRALLTGTPVQNNQQELLNLLQFLDPKKYVAKELGQKYKEETQENISKLRDLIRPNLLRRLKFKVLGFLPPMTQLVVPIKMSILQKEVYRAIMGKDPELLEQIIFKPGQQTSPAHRAKLNNLLMQLRKCLCHPYQYSKAVDPNSADPEVWIRDMIDASSKFQFLEGLLPKLRERKHRVLIFSQFLEQLDLLEELLEYLGLRFQRIDGNVDALDKQERIDEFNAPDSELFAFLLSTRAGGVGINLATADTVIIMDSDFNPHQDVQASSRAHRIGQEKPVLVMQLATKRSVEEQILKKGKKKLALEQALIEGIDVEDDKSMDFESILRDGAQALFEDDDGENGDEAYTSAEVDAILDQREKERNLDKDDEENAVTHFSSVRVWAHDKGTFVTENVVQSKSDAPDLGKWKILLQERKLAAAAEAKKNLEDLGRGKRARKKTDYTGKGSGAIEGDLSEEESAIGRKKRNRRAGEEGDGDFGPAEASEDESEDLGQLSERSGSKTFGSKGTKVEILTKSISTPPTMSVKAPKGRAPNSSVKSAKLQQGVQIKKGVDVSRPQPKIGTAVKRPKAPVMIESKAKNSRSLGKMQQAQINGHTACSKGAETQKMATGFPAKQQARIIDLPPEPNIAKRESKVIKQVALFSGLPAKTKQADTSDEVEANKASIALATQSALGGPSLVSSERRSPSPSLSKTRAAGHKSQTNTIKINSSCSSKKSTPLPRRSSPRMSQSNPVHSFPQREDYYQGYEPFNAPSLPAGPPVQHDYGNGHTEDRHGQERGDGSHLPQGGTGKSNRSTPQNSQPILSQAVSYRATKPPKPSIGSRSSWTNGPRPETYRSRAAKRFHTSNGCETSTNFQESREPYTWQDKPRLMRPESPLGPRSGPLNDPADCGSCGWRHLHDTKVCPRELGEKALRLILDKYRPDLLWPPPTRIYIRYLHSLLDIIRAAKKKEAEKA